MIDHVHGLGYAGDNGGLYFATHTGLKIYRDGNWYETSKNFNDYMGFNAVDKGFYTSGHPGADSDLPNPIGLQRSFNGGETLESLAFEGETDFHAMGVGYFSHDIIVMNPMKNSELDVGFYKSTDEGKSWEAVQALNLTGDIFALAIHPTDSNIIAAATTMGIFLSRDGGKHFEQLTEAAQGTAVFFNEDNLYYASYHSIPELIQYKLDDDKGKSMNLPDLQEDVPIYISQHPQNNQEIAFYTTKGQAFLTTDGAESWKQILVDGSIN
ncbi:hypothetical protein GMD78_12605 [Ornithinibacillus sp. L9]|uniref:Sortilin N-terminal domain-containing protein n=2 Tax=Ornithinibacillus caprae TaxID=2678566 RepID=A0A6N8FIF7_9BACI|nr:hypothetical protein [Ornithinibacillus caprae]